jgi:hypothetical protein
MNLNIAVCDCNANLLFSHRYNSASPCCKNHVQALAIYLPGRPSDFLFLQNSTSLGVATAIETSKVFQRRFPDETEKFKISKTKQVFITLNYRAV